MSKDKGSPFVFLELRRAAFLAQGRVSTSGASSMAIPEADLVSIGVKPGEDVTAKVDRAGKRLLLRKPKKEDPARSKLRGIQRVAGGSVRISIQTITRMLELNLEGGDHWPTTIEGGNLIVDFAEPLQ